MSEQQQMLTSTGTQTTTASQLIFLPMMLMPNGQFVPFIYSQALQQTLPLTQQPTTRITSSNLSSRPSPVITQSTKKNNKRKKILKENLVSPKKDKIESKLESDLSACAKLEQFIKQNNIAEVRELLKDSVNIENLRKGNFSDKNNFLHLSSSVEMCELIANHLSLEEISNLLSEKNEHGYKPLPLAIYLKDKPIENWMQKTLSAIFEKIKTQSMPAPKAIIKNKKPRYALQDKVIPQSPRRPFVPPRPKLKSDPSILEQCIRENNITEVEGMLDFNKKKLYDNFQAGNNAFHLCSSKAMCELIAQNLDNPVILQFLKRKNDESLTPLQLAQLLKKEEVITWLQQALSLYRTDFVFFSMEKTKANLKLDRILEDLPKQKNLFKFLSEELKINQYEKLIKYCVEKNKVTELKNILENTAEVRRLIIKNNLGKGKNVFDFVQSKEMFELVSAYIPVDKLQKLIKTAQINRKLNQAEAGKVQKKSTPSNENKLSKKASARFKSNFFAPLPSKTKLNRELIQQNQSIPEELHGSDKDFSELGLPMTPTAPLTPFNQMLGLPDGTEQEESFNLTQDFLQPASPAPSTPVPPLTPLNEVINPPEVLQQYDLCNLVYQSLPLSPVPFTPLQPLTPLDQINIEEEVPAQSTVWNGF